MLAKVTRSARDRVFSAARTDMHTVNAAAGPLSPVDSTDNLGDWPVPKPVS